jgi:hypothetical protein
VAEPQPSSLAGNKLHGVEVRAMRMSAATQFRAGTRRGTPPRGGVMELGATAGCAATAPRATADPQDSSWPGASQQQPESLKPPYKPFRNVLLACDLTR